MSHVCSFFFQFDRYRYFCLPLSPLCLFVSFPPRSCYPFQPVSSHRSDMTETTVWRRTSFRPIAVLSTLFPQLHVPPGEGHSWKAPMQRPGGCSGTARLTPGATPAGLWMLLASGACTLEPSARQDVQDQSPPGPYSCHTEPTSPERGRSSAWHGQGGRSPQDLLCGVALRADRWSHMGKLIIVFSFFFPGHL